MTLIRKFWNSGYSRDLDRDFKIPKKCDCKPRSFRNPKILKILKIPNPEDWDSGVPKSRDFHDRLSRPADIYAWIPLIIAVKSNNFVTALNCGGKIKFWSPLTGPSVLNRLKVYDLTSPPYSTYPTNRANELFCIFIFGCFWSLLWSEWVFRKTLAILTADIALCKNLIYN